MHFHAQKAHRPAFRHVVHGGKLHFGRIDHGDGARTLDVHDVVRLDEGRRVLVEADADRERVIGERGQQPAQTVTLPEMLVDDEPIGDPETGREPHRAGHGGASLVAERDHMLAQEGGTGAGSCHRNAGRVQLPDSLRDRRATDQGREPELVAPGEENSGRILESLEPARFLGVAPRIEIQRDHTAGAHLAEKAFVSRPRLAHQAGGRDDRDVRRGAARQFDEAPQDLRGILFVLCASDRHDPAPPAALRHSACTHSFTAPDFWTRDHATPRARLADMIAGMGRLRGIALNPSLHINKKSEDYDFYHFY